MVYDNRMMHTHRKITLDCTVENGRKCVTHKFYSY